VKVGSGAEDQVAGVFFHEFILTFPGVLHNPLRGVGDRTLDQLRL
jgi:hypothetical protein